MKKVLMTSVALVLLFGGMAFAAYIDNGDGTVTDTATGLMWQQATTADRTWEAALDDAETLTLAGYDDWRLPNSRELQSIVDYGQYNPAIDAAAFPGTLSSNYWSSTTPLHNGAVAWCVGFDYGGIAEGPKVNAYALRAVRGGQARTADNLVVTAPAQASRFPIGIPQTILWDTAGIAGNVKITLSRQGGKPGTFSETIAENAPNSGFYTCTLQGPETFNGALRIEPLSDPDKGATQSLFTLKTLLGIEMAVEQLGDTGHYRAVLNSRYDDGRLPLATTFASSDPSVAAVNAFGFLTALKNGYVEVSTTYNGVTYRRGLFVYRALSAAETEVNDTRAAADAMVLSTADATLSKFYKGTLPKGDTDWFRFTLSQGAMVNIGYLSESAAADVRVDLFDGADVLMASAMSTDGTQKVLSTGLPAGDYYLKLTPAGDIDPTTTINYIAAYKIPGSFPAKSPVPLVFNGTVTGTVGSLADQEEITFTLAAEQAIRLLFTPSSPTAQYRLTLLDAGQTVIDRIDCLDQEPVSFQALYGAGSYTLLVTPLDAVDAQNPFTLSLSALEGQWEKELNGTAAQATAWDLTRPMNGRLSLETDADFFRFRIDSPRFLALGFAVPGSAGNFTLTLFRESVDHEIDGIAVAKGQTATLNMGLGAGNYYLRVQGGAAPVDRVHNYILTLQDPSRRDLEIEPNNTLKAAGAIDGDQARSGRIYSALDRDFYGFHLSEDGFVSLTFTPTTTTGDYRVSLVDVNTGETGTPLYTFTSANGQVISAAELYFEAAGDYYVKIEPNGDIDPDNPYTLALAPLSAVTMTGVKQLVNLAVTGETRTMTVNGTQTLVAMAGYSDAAVAQVTPTWTSLNPAVATVSPVGLVTALGQGTTAIVASYGGIAGRFDLTVGAPAPVVSQHHGNLILVGGGGYQPSNGLRGATLYLTDLVYRRFRERLFSDDDIYFFHPWPAHDLNADGFPENIVRDTSPTAAKLGLAMTQWAASRSTDGPLYLFLVDHGGVDSFVLFEDENHVRETLTAAQLKGFLDAFQAATGRQVVVMIDAPKSGSFVNDLTAAGSNRIVVTSTNDQYPFLSPLGTDSFTQFFMDNLWQGDSLQLAFTKAAQNLAGLGWPYHQQAPQLSGALAAQSVWIGGAFPITATLPSFSGQSADKSIAANAVQTLFASFSPAVLSAIEAVWAVIVPPVYELSGEQILQFPTLELTDPGKDGRYEGSYSAFAYNGEYRVVFYAKTADGRIILSGPTVFTVTGGLEVKSLQVVKAGAGRGTVASQPAGIDCGDACRKFYDVDTDVVLTATAEAGFAFAGWSGSNCAGTGTCNLEVNGVKTVTATFSDIFGDIDGDGAAGLTDAVLVLRIMAGFSPPGTLSLGADVDQDGRIGLPEVIYILQRVAGGR